MAQTKLHKECEGCSWCCEHQIVPLVPDMRIAKFHQTWGNETILDSKSRLWSVMKCKCQHLTDEGLCDDYENRPLQCQNFPNAWDDIYGLYCKLIQTNFEKEKEEDGETKP